MDHPNQRTLTTGRAAVRWFIFLVFFHLLPVPWFMVVVAGLAPASFLFAIGVAGLFVTDFDSLPMALMFLAAALISGLIFFLLTNLLTAGIRRLKNPIAITLSLIIILVACLGIALNPVYFSGGHGGQYQFSLLDFLDILGQFRVPPAVSISYFICLTLLLAGLLVYQHTPQSFPTLPLSREQRRQLFRWSMLGGLILFIALICWTHRALFFLKPLADMGVAGAQYRLALALHKNPGSELALNSDSRYYLERAAEQGHIDAAMALARLPRSADEKLRWLTVAAEGGQAEAQYQLYLFMMKSSMADYKSRSALDWLKSAAESGIADAQYELGRNLIYGNQKLSIEKDSKNARQWWDKAAENGHGRAMEELAWRYSQGAEGFPRDPAQAIFLLEKIADGYRQGHYGLPENQQMASSRHKQAEDINALEERVARGDPEALATIGRQLLGSQTTRSQGITLLEKAARGDARIQYELGAIFLFGRHGIDKNLEMGRKWWDLALAQKHVKTMEYVAPAYQNGRFGYPVDLLKSKALVELLVEAYREGRFGVEPDAERERYWTAELKHFDRLFELAGGSFSPFDDLYRQAIAGDLQAQYQLGRQLLVAGSEDQRQKGLQWIERSAEGGYAEAQYRLVTYYENKIHIMRDNPSRGIALLQSAAKQKHLPAMGALALAYEKGRYGLAQDYQQAQYWYRELLQAYESGQYLGEVDDRFIRFQRSRLEYMHKARQYQEDRSRRYEQATTLERQIMEIEDRYRLKFQKAVNGLTRQDGSREGKKQFRAQVEQLRQEYSRQRELEIEQIKRKAADGR